ncbi:helix-turn-helix transcriptional regulator [Symbioplanes lichenis]|uniref:helix-turn-helix transcriptional regulator n=1 Tax=Symbioplanes lichenis TaxID=1629072 RepID=UPI00273A47F7|nr:AraC family transcriptional regulator [Actinoplanes lichenis]
MSDDGGLRPQRWRTILSDEGLARQELARLLAPAGLTLDAAAGSGFRLGVDAVRLGPLLAVSMSFAMPLTATMAGLGGYHFTLSDAGRGQLVHEGARVEVDRGHAAAAGPGDAVTFRHGADFRPLALIVDEAALRQELAVLTGMPAARRLRFASSLTVTSGAAASWCRTVRSFRAEGLAGDSLLQYPLIAEHMRHLVVAGALLCLPHSHRAELDQPAAPMHPASLRRVVTAIEDRPEQPFSVGDLAAIGRISVRTLQIGFQRHLGMSPTAYLRQVRLGRAHQLLLAGLQGQETVAAVAHRCGFAHLGRFSRAYRQRYGAAPSETLRLGD